MSKWTTNTNKLFMGFVLYNRLRIAGTLISKFEIKMNLGFESGQVDVV